MAGIGLPAVWADDSSGQVRIQVRENNLVKGETILLGEVADIEADTFLTGVLKEISLGDSPKPGKVKPFEKRRILFLLQSRNLIHEGMNISCPDRVYVKRESQTIEEDQVKERVAAFLTERFGNRLLEIERIKIRGLAPCPAGEVELLVSGDNPVDRYGRLSLFIDVLVDGRRQDRIRITGTVAESKKIVCASRNLEKGETVLAQDLTLQRVNVFHVRGDVLEDPGAAAGKKLKASIRKGSPLDPSDLMDTPLVEKGDIVTLVARKENLVIRTTGVIQEDGYADEMILVENISSGKTVRGFVRNASTIEVVY